MTARIPAALPDHHEDRTSYPYPLQTHANYWKTYQIRLKSLLPDPRLAPISTLHEPNSLSHQSLADREALRATTSHNPGLSPRDPRGVKAARVVKTVGCLVRRYIPPGVRGLWWRRRSGR